MIFHLDLVAIIVGTIGGILFLILLIIGIILYRKYRFTKRYLRSPSQIALREAHSANFGIYFIIKK